MRTPIFKRIIPALLLLVSSGIHALPGDSANSGLKPLNFIVAVVNDDVILASELKSEIQSVVEELRANGSRIPPANILNKQVLDRTILTKLQLQEANAAGIRVDDDTLNRAVRNIARKNGLSLAQFRQTLLKEGFDFSSFREQIRKQLVINQLRQRQVESRVSVSPQEVDAYLSNAAAQGKDQREFHLAHIQINVPSNASSDQVRKARELANTVVSKARSGEDFAALAAQYSSGRRSLEGGDLGWRKISQLPSLFNEKVPGLKKGQITDPVRSPIGYHILKLLDSRSSEVHMVQQVKARHILIKPNEVITEPEARRRLAVLRERLLAGDDFATLARANSDDTGSAVKGGELGWLSPGETVPAFEKILFSLGVNEISEPFKSVFGWHIAQVLDHRKHDASTEVKRSEAASEIRKRKKEEQLELWLRQLRDNAFIEYRIDL